ncbi:hypothetical protein [Pseudocolwellia agarivorans]|uniref:hypothetical protein n=1 Tax=Pseudocolwellia agarivorans TaxID=1911682 RepID=UPI0009868B49|nr:hypothetical protein [Pseudocolwellia agarivorans]
MRNLAIALVVVCGFVWLFFTTILLEDTDNDNGVSLEEVSSLQMKNSGDATADIKNLALLLGVEYQEENEKEVEIKTTLDVEIGVVVIYTSEKNLKVRVRTLVNGKQEQRDMVIGDKLYNFVLTAITPSSVELNDGENIIILKVFKNTVISVTDLPKESPDLL